MTYLAMCLPELWSHRRRTRSSQRIHWQRSQRNQWLWSQGICWGPRLMQATVVQVCRFYQFYWKCILSTATASHFPPHNYSQKISNWALEKPLKEKQFWTIAANLFATFEHDSQTKWHTCTVSLNNPLLQVPKWAIAECNWKPYQGWGLHMPLLLQHPHSQVQILHPWKQKNISCLLLGSYWQQKFRYATEDISEITQWYWVDGIWHHSIIDFVDACLIANKRSQKIRFTFILTYLCTYQPTWYRYIQYQTEET